MSALDKAKAKNQELMERQRKRAAREKSTKSAIMTEAMGQLGELTGATATAVVDAKFAGAVGDMATFGESNVPAAPVVGFLVGLGSLALIRPAPKAAAFFGRMGTMAAYIGVYHGVRDKAAGYFEG